MQDRTVIPFRWAAVRYHHINDFLCDHVLTKLGADYLYDFQIRKMAKALKYDYATFKRKYDRAFHNQVYGISDNESEAASAASIDKNTIG